MRATDDVTGLSQESGMDLLVIKNVDAKMPTGPAPWFASAARKPFEGSGTFARLDDASGKRKLFFCSLPNRRCVTPGRDKHLFI
jgi:hypothetical protein